MSLEEAVCTVDEGVFMTAGRGAVEEWALVPEDEGEGGGCELELKLEPELEGSERGEVVVVGGVATTGAGGGASSACGSPVRVRV